MLEAIATQVEDLAELNVVGSVKSTAFRRGDVMVLTLNERLSEEGMRRASEAMRRVFPDNQCVILPAGAELEVFRRDDGVVTSDHTTPPKIHMDIRSPMTLDEAVKVLGSR